ncbi:MAG: extracellular solute-binding protein [Planctomycetes bacterium]|nr:extracellular solute-binding protein [Planctomycetota bacterium]
MFGRVVVIIAIAVVLIAPFAFRTERPKPVSDARRVIIITPHNEQIRTEFARGFARWHEGRYGEPAAVVYNVPGGTSEIRKMLESQYAAALQKGETPGGDADLVFGGGSYEHGRLKRGVTVTVDGEKRSEPITQPVTLDPSRVDLAEIYGQEKIGNIPLYDPDGYWFGTALSGFGIVYNRDALGRNRIATPTTWADLCHPDLQGWVALVNPGQSGSITTAFEAILQHLGWETGWRILRRAGANARYFSASSLRPPTDVGEGDAAIGVCIDFYGRFQSQALTEAGYPDRLGYVDPPGATTIDPDPISMLRGAPNREMAERFIEFCLSPEGQALWQFRASDEHPDGLGPHEFELRRMMVRRSMYEDHFDRAIDQVNPYEIARAIENPDRNVRRFVSVVFSAMVMDNHHELRDAWSAITSHPAFPRDEPLADAASVDDPDLRRMLLLFDAMPDVPGPDGASYSIADTEHLGTLAGGWMKGGWMDEGLWPADADPQRTLRRDMARFFRESYEAITP